MPLYTLWPRRCRVKNWTIWSNDERLKFRFFVTFSTFLIRLTINQRLQMWWNIINTRPMWLHIQTVTKCLNNRFDVFTSLHFFSKTRIANRMRLPPIVTLDQENMQKKFHPKISGRIFFRHFYKHHKTNYLLVLVVE